jgi:hypothetical protein
VSSILDSLRRHQPADRATFHDRLGSEHPDVVIATLTRRCPTPAVRALFLVVAACVVGVLVTACVLTGRPPWALLEP